VWRSMTRWHKTDEGTWTCYVGLFLR
jgi:hypothetical protein